MDRDDKSWLGTILGASIITASAVGTAAAISRGRERSIYEPLETGQIAGYETYPGEPYDVYRKVDEETYELIARPVGIWFGERWDYFKYLYDNLRSFGLTVRGTYVAVGHSIKAGVHSMGRKAPMRGYNNFGVKGGSTWMNKGKPFWIADTKEVVPGTMVRQYVPDAKWRFYWTMQDAVDNWLRIMHGTYPMAHAELFEKHPDPYQYHEGLMSGKGGKKYATGAFNMGEVIEEAMEYVPELLNEHFGYNLPIGD